MHPVQTWRRTAALLAGLALTAILAGCASDGKDEFAGRNAEKLYAEAKADADAGSYERAIKALERVEGLGAGTLLASMHPPVASTTAATTAWPPAWAGRPG